ncbi:MAG: translation initiation factor 1 [Clostridiales bacterium]|jgi:translation initiation factor 1|nr:translation initiation factor 1 [Clostridiales bacterium]MDN5282780.1 translation initiation factor 1 [Candidatus Ozemobacter sp.]
MKAKGGLVYSSEFGRMCPGCSKPIDSCQCKQKQPSSQSKDGIVRVSRETKGRKGSGVTLIKGLSGSEDELKKLTTLLKRKCGAGGALKDGIIEIQGEHRDKLVEELQKLGYKAKKAGG